MAEPIIMQNLPKTMKQFYSQLETQESFRELFEKLDNTKVFPEDFPEDKDFLERLRFADERPLASEAERERISEILQDENFKGVRTLVTQSVEDLFPKGKE
jgi:hypothetical protein